MKDYMERKTSLKDKTKNGMEKMQKVFKSNTTMYFDSTVGRQSVDRRKSTRGMVKSTYDNIRRLSVRGFSSNIKNKVAQSLENEESQQILIVEDDGVMPDRDIYKYSMRDEVTLGMNKVNKSVGHAKQMANWKPYEAL